MPRYFEFEIALCGIEPRIWRRLLLPTSATFHDLHVAIQDSCNWMDAHLYLFLDLTRQVIAGVPGEKNEHGEPDPDSRKVKLSKYFRNGFETVCVYLYDFGDAWELLIVLNQTVELEEYFERRLVDGQRAFPPEDCGGLPGYEECVRVASGGRDTQGLREWLDGWHPEKFDLEETRHLLDVAVEARRFVQESLKGKVPPLE